MDTAKGLKEISNFFGVMEVAYRVFFQFQLSGTISSLMHRRKNILKFSKSLNLVTHAGHAGILLSICTSQGIVAW